MKPYTFVVLVSPLLLIGGLCLGLSQGLDETYAIIAVFTIGYAVFTAFLRWKRHPGASRWAMYTAQFVLPVGAYCIFIAGSTIIPDFFGDDLVATRATRVAVALAVAFLLAFIAWFKWRLHDLPNLERSTHFEGHGISTLGWVFLGLDVLLAAIMLGLPFVILDAFSDVAKDRPLVRALHGLGSITYAIVACLVAWPILVRVLNELVQYRRLRRAFSKLDHIPVKQVAFTSALSAKFRVLLESEREMSFWALTVRFRDWLLVIEPVGSVAGGDQMSVDVTEITREASEIVDGIRKFYPSLSIGMVNVHSHPAMRQGYVPEVDEQALLVAERLEALMDSPDILEKGLVGDGAYLDRLLGFFRFWFSSQDRALLQETKSYCGGMGILVWGIDYEGEHHPQLRPDYDVVAFRAASVDAESCTDAILPLFPLESISGIQTVFANGVGERLLRKFREEISHRTSPPAASPSKATIMHAPLKKRFA